MANSDLCYVQPDPKEEPNCEHCGEELCEGECENRHCAESKECDCGEPATVADGKTIPFAARQPRMDYYCAACWAEVQSERREMNLLKATCEDAGLPI